MSISNKQENIIIAIVEGKEDVEVYRRDANYILIDCDDAHLRVVENEGKFLVLEVHTPVEEYSDEHAMELYDNISFSEMIKKLYDLFETY